MKRFIAIMMLCVFLLLTGCGRCEPPIGGGDGGGNYGQLPPNFGMAAVIDNHKGEDFVVVFYSSKNDRHHLWDRRLRRAVRQSKYQLYFVDIDTRNGRDMADKVGVRTSPCGMKVRVSQAGEARILATLTDKDYRSIEHFLGN